MELNNLISISDVIINPITKWSNISHIITNFIYYIGEYMDSAICFIVLFTLRKNLMLYFFFFVGLCLSVILNFILKKIIKIKRPCINIHLFDLLIKNNKEYLLRNGKNYCIYGMPSGHSQLCGYTFVFLTLLLKNNSITLFYLFLTILTMYQRVKYEHHTFLQVIIGVSFGCLLGLGVHYFVNQKFTGNIMPKKDDNCYIK